MCPVSTRTLEVDFRASFKMLQTDSTTVCRKHMGKDRLEQITSKDWHICPQCCYCGPAERESEARHSSANSLWIMGGGDGECANRARTEGNIASKL